MLLLSVVREGARRDVEVDLPETFNALIGLRVESRRRLDGVLAVAGTDAGGRKCLILWRRLAEIDSAALDTWFDRHRARFSQAVDVVYANGDHTLSAMRRHGETWTAQSIEPVLRTLMFEPFATDER